MTRCPSGACCSVPGGPRSAATPHGSWPVTYDDCPCSYGRRSLPHMPEARMATTTSPGPGRGSANSRSSTLRSPRNTRPRMRSRLPGSERVALGRLGHQVGHGNGERVATSTQTGGGGGDVGGGSILTKLALALQPRDRQLEGDYPARQVRDVALVQASGAPRLWRVTFKGVHGSL